MSWNNEKERREDMNIAEKIQPSQIGMIEKLALPATTEQLTKEQITHLSEWVLTVPFVPSDRGRNPGFLAEDFFLFKRGTAVAKVLHFFALHGKEEARRLDIYPEIWHDAETSEHTE